MSRGRSLDYLAVEDLLEIASGILPAVSIRDPGLLASAVARPQTSVAGQEAYSRFAEKAAALMHSLARNHPLVDGNKRLAWAATRVCCLLNGHDLSLTVDEAEELVVATAAGELDVPELTRRIGDKLVAA
ncbi:MAG TPA: type II toxin-antitoxin system death-on-curing family toxin [Gaiellaceae bacterium]|nr:type II toxin-antitoxin system death-on-curing family toxin [Gaiellaceae bacterium]